MNDEDGIINRHYADSLKMILVISSHSTGRFYDECVSPFRPIYVNIHRIWSERQKEIVVIANG
jgi:hypothetical protein